MNMRCPVCNQLDYPNEGPCYDCRRAVERPTLVPETYPALEHEVYLSLEPRTERPTEPAPFDLDALAEAV